MHFCIFSKGAYFVHRDKWIGFTLGCPAALVVLRPYSGSWGGHWSGGNDRVKGGMWGCGGSGSWVQSELAGAAHSGKGDIHGVWAGQEEWSYEGGV